MLSPEELEMLWKDKAIKEKIAERVRSPGDLHEWCMVCETPKFKEWDVSMAEIKRFRTLTDELKFTDPATGVVASHSGGPGTVASAFHKELREVIKDSTGVADFNTRLVGFYDRWAVPASSRPAPLK